MIFDALKNKDNYRHDPLLFQALEYLSSLEPGTLPSETQVLTEGILLCNPVCFTSKPESECRYEATGIISTSIISWKAWKASQPPTAQCSL